LPLANLELPIVRVHGFAPSSGLDVLAVEEPLEIRVAWGKGDARVEKSLSVTMRTPGDDRELAAGFLYTEGIVGAREDILSIERCVPEPSPGVTRLPLASDALAENVIRVELGAQARVDLARLERHFYTSSSCGVCGKTSLEAVRAAKPPRLKKGTPVVRASVLHAMPGALRARQEGFTQTGGLHAAALFDPNGALIALREDVGRHNALDKLIGAQLLAGALPAKDALLLVSGRASFELVQKALMAGIAVLAAVGAPSSLAIALAREAEMTLIGFLRDQRFNVYCGGERVEEVRA
jgi:FdhD protein